MIETLWQLVALTTLGFFWAGCPCCTGSGTTPSTCFGASGACTGAAGKNYRVDVTGHSNGDCTDCGSRNGSYFMTIPDPGASNPFGQCIARINVGPWTGIQRARCADLNCLVAASCNAAFEIGFSGPTGYIRFELICRGLCIPAGIGEFFGSWDTIARWQKLYPPTAGVDCTALDNYTLDPTSQQWEGNCSAGSCDVTTV